MDTEIRKHLSGIHSKMLSRCYNPNDTCFYKYGARGITVCDEWRASRQAFIDWAISQGYVIGLQIDRKKNHLNYAPDNCRIVTRRQNMQNRLKIKSINGRPSKSKYKGVTPRAGGRFQAQITVGDKRVHLGRFTDEESAARAYDYAASIHHGEYACLNFPDETPLPVTCGRTQVGRPVLPMQAVTVRVPPELWDRAKAAANQDRKSLNSLCLMAITEAVERLEARKQGATA